MIKGSLFDMLWKRASLSRAHARFIDPHLYPQHTYRFSKGKNSEKKQDILTMLHNENNW